MRLKFSVVKPLFKSSDKHNVSNYRPLSLPPAFSKVIEKVIYSRLYQHLTRNKILSNDQYGFKKNSTTNKASYKLVNEIMLAMNNKFTVGGGDLPCLHAFYHNVRYSFGGNSPDSINVFRTQKRIISCNTRHITNLHFPKLCMTAFQKGPYYSGMRAYNYLPSCMKSLNNEVKTF
jgi:hypothetical protein